MEESKADMKAKDNMERKRRKGSKRAKGEFFFVCCVL